MPSASVKSKLAVNVLPTVWSPAVNVGLLKFAGLFCGSIGIEEAFKPYDAIMDNELLILGKTSTV